MKGVCNQAGVDPVRRLTRCRLTTAASGMLPRVRLSEGVNHIIIHAIRCSIHHVTHTVVTTPNKFVVLFNDSMKPNVTSMDAGCNKCGAPKCNPNANPNPPHSENPPNAIHL